MSKRNNNKKHLKNLKRKRKLKARARRGSSKNTSYMLTDGDGLFAPYGSNILKHGSETYINGQKTRMVVFDYKKGQWQVDARDVRQIEQAVKWGDPIEWVEDELIHDSSLSGHRIESLVRKTLRKAQDIYQMPFAPYYCHRNAVRYAKASGGRASVRFGAGMMYWPKKSPKVRKVTDERPYVVEAWPHSWNMEGDVRIDVSTKLNNMKRVDDMMTYSINGEVRGEFVEYVGYSTIDVDKCKPSHDEACWVPTKEKAYLDDMMLDAIIYEEHFRRDTVDAIWTEAHRLARAA